MLCLYLNKEHIYLKQKGRPIGQPCTAAFKFNNPLPALGVPQLLFLWAYLLPHIL